ncbi:MAG: glycerophosphodiester phosphodiesterase [Anaerolineales bacterium]|nr:glycerophosphodiester phosphodiesterase [Anaerolineales bacterium]
MKLTRWQIVLALFILALVVLRLFSKPAPTFPYYADLPHRPLVIAHQGGDNVWPGETMYAYQHAAELGADVLEMDIHITKDGEIILMHDETVDRTTDGSGEIESMTLAELKTLDAAYNWSLDGGATHPYRGQGLQIVALKEIFQAFPHYRMTIEIKKTRASMAKPFCDLIRQYDMQDKVVVASFMDDKLKEFRAECPEVATSSAKNETTVFVLLSKVYLGGFYSPKFQSLQVPEESSGITIMTPAFVRAAHERNIAVEPWTIDDAQTIRKFADWGVDGIMTDRPDVMIETLGR